MQMNVVLLEDEIPAGEALRDLLKNKGFNCTHYNKVEDLLTHPFPQVDLFLLDYHLHGKPEGAEAAKKLRAAGVLCPIIMLTSETQEEIVLSCFNEGDVDDYYNKPVRIDELVVRVNKHLSKSKTKKKLVHNGLTVDLGCATVFLGTSPLDVTHSEYRIIQCLLENKGRIIHRQEIIDYINDEKTVVGKRTIDTQINTIRNKISKDILEIKSKRGFGYGVLA